MKKDIAPELASLTGPFTKIARAMSAQWGVRIVPSGAKCATDGETIFIPYTADYLPLHMRQILHGHLDHEVCHVAEEKRHRESGQVTPLTMMKSEPNTTIRMLFNVFEDIRIETRYSEIYPGMGENLDAGNRESAKEWQRRVEGGEESNFWQTFGSAVILTARGQDADWARTDPEVAEAMDLCKKEIAVSTKRLGWGSDAMDLARRVYEKLKKHAQKQQEPQEGGEGEDGQSGGGGGKGHKKPSQGQEGGNPAESSGGEEDKPQPGALGEAEIEDLTDLVRAKMEDYVIEDARIHERYIPHPTALRMDTEIQCPNFSEAYYLKARAEVAQQIGGLRARQRSVLQSWQRRKVRTGLEEGFIDDDALPSVRLGDRRVFTDMTKKRDLNTAIEVLIDCSGSMGSNGDPGDSAFYALRTAIALTEAWSALGVANEFTGFYNTIGRYYPDEPGYVCRPPFHYQVFKSFGDKLSKVRGRFCSIEGRGSNADGEAVLWAARRLASRPEARKILVVISDGMPATDGLGWDFTPLQRHLRHAVKQVSSSGIEVIGIGAGVDTPRHFYNEDTGASFVVIKDISTMAVDIFKIMKKKLMGVAA